MSVPTRSRILASSVAVALLFSAPMSAAQASTKAAVGDADNHRVISIRANTQITITLDSTFWMDATTTNLKLVKDKIQRVIPFGPTAPVGCQHPGTGCGTSIWVFKAATKGKASFTVSRNSCGEVLQCAPNKKNYVVRFIVK